MDIELPKPPLPINGLYWSTANCWIIGTGAKAVIATPQLTTPGAIPIKHEVAASIEATQNIEALCVLDELPLGFPFAHAVVLLASDSTIRIFASLKNPELANWVEVGSGGFGHGAEHVCAISSVIMHGGDGDPVPVVACGDMGGTVSLVGLGVANDKGTVESTSVLKFSTRLASVSYLAWLPDTRSPTDPCILAVCASDGTVQLWNVSRDISQASLLTTVCHRDWRPITAHTIGRDLLILVKLGKVIIVDFHSSLDAPAVQSIALPVTQTIVACAIDERRGRVYIGSFGFEVFVLQRVDGRKWQRAAGCEDALLFEGMKKTVVRSFTTMFNMQRLFLRGMLVSPNERFLTFVVDDQVNWDVVKDGAKISRIHFHQLGDWTLDDSKRVLEKLAAGNYHGTLRYNMWDVLESESAENIGALATYLSQKSTSSGDAQNQQWLFMLNIVGSILEDDQYKPLLAKAHNQALDQHVKSLFNHINAKLSDSTFSNTDKDQAYLAQVNWAVHQPAYADVVGQLPPIVGNTSEAVEGNCPICHTEMTLLSKQTACCTKNHIFDVCSVSLSILKSPGSDQCNTCKAKRKHVNAGHSGSLASKILAEFPHCPFCKGRFYPAVV